LPPAEASPAAEPAKPALDESDAPKKAPPDKVSAAGTASKTPQPRATAPIDEKLLAKKPEPARSKPAAVSGGQWIVQLGAYKDPANVRNLTAKLKQQGYNFYTEALPSADGSKRTRVRAGPFPSREAAETARDRIKRIGVNGVVAEKGA
jgi:DedD protein